jgi:hypothetical protein
MKVLMLYRPNSEQASTVESYVRDFLRLHSDKKVELKDADSKEGMALMDVYGITRTPALIVVTDEGQVVNIWQDELLPLMDEVLGYLV